MDHINELSHILKGIFAWNKPRISCLAQLIIGLFIFRTVNLVELSQSFIGTASPKSNYRRIQRFFKQVTFENDLIPRFSAALFSPSSGAWHLSLDRTNWKFGKSNINILMLSLVWHGIAIPLMWSYLPKQGNSNPTERTALIKRFLKLFGHDKIASILMDREFAGKDWLGWLSSQDINFTVRTKKNILMLSLSGRRVPIKLLFGSLKSGRHRVLKNKRAIFGLELWCTAAKLTTGEWLLVITNHAPEDCLNRYSLRWQIETLFGCLKTRGFNFESTHLTDLNKLDTLLCLLTIAFCWAYKTGEWCQKKDPIKYKQHGRREKSVFRVGLDHIRIIIINIANKIEQFYHALEQLRVPIYDKNHSLFRET